MRSAVNSGHDCLRPGDPTSAGIFDGRRVAADIGVTSQARQCPEGPVHEYAVSKNKQRASAINNDLKPKHVALRAAIWPQG